LKDFNQKRARKPIQDGNSRHKAVSELLDSEEQAKPAEKPISLHPLKFEEAVQDLLRVKPKTQD
jgi:hypothetical protein